MEIEFVTYGTIRDAVGEKRLRREFEAGTSVRDALDALASEYDSLGSLLLDNESEVRPNVNVLVEEENIRLGEGDATVLSDGDTVGLAPGLSGGGQRVSRVTHPGVSA
jgi:molybdopterin synthase sulfur carrier subunit